MNEQFMNFMLNFVVRLFNIYTMSSWNVKLCIQWLYVTGLLKRMFFSKLHPLLRIFIEVGLQ